MKTKKKRYFKAAKEGNIPNREEAMVLDFVEALTIEDYVSALATLIGVDKIRFLSRIPHGKICLYVKSKKTVEELVASSKQVQIKGHTLDLRPLMSKARRVIISNVSPTIPNSLIKRKLDDLKINLQSQILYMRIGISEEKYAHIFNFCRQMYIEPEDIEKLPAAIEINYGNTNYWIHFTISDNLKCLLCEEEGHLIAQCRNLEPTISETSQHKGIKRASSTSQSSNEDNLESDSEDNEEPGKKTRKETETKSHTDIH